MSNPYADLPDRAFWKRSMAGQGPDTVDPVAQAGFRIGPDEPIATAGSCFAQHVSRALQARGYRYLVTEAAPPQAKAADSYGVYPARFGNIYTARQLLQTIERAYGRFEPLDRAWSRPDGALVDPFRPQVEPDGFASLQALEADRDRHLAAVRDMFEQCRVFVFTLGLTEAWRSVRDGAVFPLAPGVAGGEFGPDYAFHNFSAAETSADLQAFVDRLVAVNPGVRVILTVSPVALIATYSGQHVLAATSYSKSVLRVSAQETAAARPNVEYFPSYEIITGPQARGRFFAEDLRSVTDEGVERVMQLFAAHFLGAASPAGPGAAGQDLTAEDIARMDALADIICDEEEIDP